MTTDTRSTTKVSQPYCIDNGVSRPCYPQGWGKTITSVRDGKLVPGTWRYNPVSIFKGTCACESEQLGRYDGPIMSYFLKSVGYDNGYWWYTSPWGSPPSVLVDKARIKAANRRLDPQFAGGVALAELKETLGMLFSPIKAARKLLKKGLVRSRRFKSRKRRIDYLSNYWLSARYGWIPLASDITDLSNVLMLGIERRRSSFYTTHGSAWVEVNADPVHLNTCKRYIIGMDYVRTEQYRYSVRSTYGWRHVLGYETEEWWTQIGLHWRDIPGVLWELVPFSFAVDWFLNVGDFISYLRPTPAISKLGEGYSTKTDYVRRFDPFQVYEPNRFGYCTQPIGVCKPLIITQSNYVRTIPTSPVMGPVLDLRWRSVKHTVDALSLIVQKLK